VRTPRSTPARAFAAAVALRRHQHPEVGTEVIENGYERLHVGDIEPRFPALAVDGERRVSEAEHRAAQQDVDLADGAAEPTGDPDVALDLNSVTRDEAQDVCDAILVLAVVDRAGHLGSPA
jgi:hypothetical protein